MRQRIWGAIARFQAPDAPAPPAALRAPARLFGLALRLRVRLRRSGWLPVRALPCAVISIGNLASGGTGKTPLTLMTAEIVRDLGHRVAVVSRGHGGSAGRRGAVVSDGRRMLLGPEAAGDEPCMLAARLAGVPVLVGHDRWRCGRMAMARFDPRVIVLDDGLQHQALARDLEIVLLDHERPLGNGWLLPAGPLRETPAALGRADALILTRSPSFSGPLPRGLPLPAVGSPAPVFRTRYLASSFLAGAAGCGPQGGRGAAVAAFSGIARNEDFVRTVAAMGHRVAAFLPYPDHHAYSAGDLAAIGRAARRCGAAMIATTEKDYARLGRRSRWPLPLLVVGVRPQFDPAGPSYPEFIAAGLERALCRKGSPAPRSVIPR